MDNLNSYPITPSVDIKPSKQEEVTHPIPSQPENKDLISLPEENAVGTETIPMEEPRY